MSKPGRVAKVAGNVGCAFCFLLLLHAPYAPLALAASPARGTDAVMPGPKAGIVAVAGVRPPCVSRCADGISLSCGCLSLRAQMPRSTEARPKSRPQRLLSGAIACIAVAAVMRSAAREGRRTRQFSAWGAAARAAQHHRSNSSQGAAIAHCVALRRRAQDPQGRRNAAPGGARVAQPRRPRAGASQTCVRRRRRAAIRHACPPSPPRKHPGAPSPASGARRPRATQSARRKVSTRARSQ